MTTQLTKNRKFVNGTSDLRGIGKRDLETPLTIDGDQFVTGSKTFVAPTRFYSDVSAGGFYYGDGSKLVNLPVQMDDTKLPLAGGVLSGPLINNSTTTLNSSVLVDGGADTRFNGPVLVMNDNILSLGEPDSGERCQISKSSIGKVNSISDFTISNVRNDSYDYQFVKLACGQSLQVDPSVNPTTGEHRIERNEHVKVFDVLNGADENKAFRFREANYYLDLNGNPGFSVLLSNWHYNPCRVEPTDDGTLFYCKDIGGEQPEFWIHQWDTTRVTLVRLSDGAYRWAVSMYR